MPLTKAQLAERIIRRLHLVPFGQTPSARERSRAEELIDEVGPKLEEFGINYWDSASVPEAVVPDLVDYIASYAGGRMVSIMQAEAHKSWRVTAERELRRITSNQDDSGEPVQSNYF